MASVAIRLIRPCFRLRLGHCYPSAKQSDVEIDTTLSEREIDQLVYKLGVYPAAFWREEEIAIVEDSPRVYRPVGS